MPADLTIGRLLLENAVPDDVRSHLGTLNKKGISRLAEALAAKGPDVYRETMKRLTDVANRAGYESGGYSFGPEDMLAGPQSAAVRQEFRDRVRQILTTPGLPPKMRDAELAKTSMEFSGKLQDVIYKEHLAAKNPLALQVESGAKGKAENLKALIAGDTLYTDQNFQPIPVPVLHSFSEGLRPAEFFAGTFGARQSIGLTKLGTAKGGWLAKRIANATHRLVVTDRDGPSHAADDNPVGYPVTTTDPDNEGAFLAHPVGGYQRNTHLTRDVLADLKKQGVDKIIIRSPLVGGPADGGVYGLDAGVRERGDVAPRGDHVGRASADSISEPITQTIIGSKHSGGVAGATTTQQGFPVLERLFAPPQNYPGGVAHAQQDGLVTAVREAPQGGHYVHVDGEEHYVAPGYRVTVTPGDKVEAGDSLSEGVLNPAEIVHHKGIGEARRAFVDELMRVSTNTGFRPNRRNVELVARGYLDHVEMNQEHGEYAPGEIASYTNLAANYEPRDGHVRKAPADVVGHYLEKPILHYTIGTRITPSVARFMNDHNVSAVTAHPNPPPFTPVLIRTNDILSHDRDWLTQSLGSGLEKSLLNSLARGATSDPTGTSYVPGLAEGVNFGSPKFKTTGWQLPPESLK